MAVKNIADPNIRQPNTFKVLFMDKNSIKYQPTKAPIRLNQQEQL